MNECFHIILLLFLATACATNQRQAKHSKTAERNASNKRQAILAEIQTLGDHEWAGEYYAGNGLGVNTYVAMAPNSGYVFQWDGCLGVYDRNYGPIVFTNGRVRLSFTFENRQEAFEGIAPELISVLWGSRHYLIPANDFVGFSNSINAGREPRNGDRGSYLLRRGDEIQLVTGFPKVPREFEHYLLAKPIETSIVAVGKYKTRPSTCDWKFKETPVVIDAGTEQGLFVGMELFVKKPEHSSESVTLSRVGATRSAGVMIQTGEDDPGPQVNWLLSTRAPWTLWTPE